METRAVRATVAAMLVAAGIVAGARVRAIDSRTTDALSRQHQLDTRLDEILATVATVRGAQQAYFQPAGDQPAGAGRQFEQVRTLTETLEQGLTALRPMLDGADESATWTRLTTTLHDFAATDTRVRANIQNETYFSAADLVFSASAGMLDTLTTDLRALETRVDQDRLATVASARRDAAIALGAASGVWLVGLVILVPTRRVRATAAPVDDATTDPLSESPVVPVTDEVARPAEPLVPTVPEAPVVVESAPMVAAVPVPAAPPSTEVHDAPALADTHAPAPLADIAALCTDLARVGSAAELRELLARVALTLGADGVIVWMGAGEELFAALGHGYPAQMLARLEPIRRDARNAAAAAWRDALPQVVPGDEGQPGALVVPLMGVGGAVGALSCELPDGREQDAARLSFAQLIAAQLSTVVAGWPAPSVVGGDGATDTDALPRPMAANQ